MRRRRDWIGGVVAASIAGAIVARTLSPGVGAGDGGELVLAARDLGIAHPPGYPLWVLLARLAALIPFGDVAARVNALSAACAALATGGLWLLGSRAGLGAAARAAACAAFALSTVVWRSAVQAEVYALATLAFVAMALLALEARAPRRGATRYRALFFLVAGLSLLAHQTLLFPAVALGVWVLARRGSAAGAAAAFGWAALGFSLALFLPVRGAVHPPFQFVPDVSLAALPDLLLRHGYGGLRQLPWTPALAAEEMAAMGAALAGAIGWPALALALLGALAGGRRRAVVLVMATAALTVPAALVAAVGFRPDAEHLAQVTPFLAPVVASVALLAGTGVEAIRRARLPRAPAARSVARLAAPSAAAVVVVAALAANYPACDRSGFELPGRYGRALLEGLPPGATLVLDGDNETFLAAYAQRAGGVRPDVTLLHRRGYVFGDPDGLHESPRSEWVGIAHRADLARLQRAETPVYYATPPEDLAAAGVRFRREGLVYRAALPGAAVSQAPPGAAGVERDWPRSTKLLGGHPERFDYVERKLAVTWSDVRARALWEEGRVAEALPWFEDAARVGFDFPEARVNLAVAAEAAGRPEVAAAELVVAHALDPRRPEAASRLAALLARAGHFREAGAWFERAYGATPDPGLAALAARAWERAGDRAKARLWSVRAGSGA